MSNAHPSVEARLEREVAAGRLEADPAQLDAARRLDRLRRALQGSERSFGARLRELLHRPRAPSGADGRGIYLWGGVGRGKTMLMDWFHESLRGTNCLRTHFYRFMREVHTELSALKGRESPLDAVAAHLARFHVICLDEFFVSDIGDAMILSGLLQGLFRSGVTLVTTSNSPPRELYQDGLQRQRFIPVIELLETRLTVVNLDGGVDYRLRQLEQAPTYLDARDPGTAERLRRQFSTLAGGAPAGPARLMIEGRPIAALATGPGLAWFEFNELCAGPRSQNDYIELARMYHTIFISDVPRLTPTDEDAARRFVMLIDEIYDRGVKLILSAAAEPTQLYRGERLALEFQRAASRLIEMQTQSYLAGRHRP